MSDRKFIINVNEKDPAFAAHIKRRLAAAQNRENLISLDDLKKRLVLHRKKLIHEKV